MAQSDSPPAGSEGSVPQDSPQVSAGGAAESTSANVPGQGLFSNLLSPQSGRGPRNLLAGALGGTGSRATSGQNTANPYRPNIPTMGGLVRTGEDIFSPWTGGKPLEDWSGLEEPSPRRIRATQHRPTSTSSAQKAEHYRTQGLETKFSKGANLLEFQDEVQKHLTHYGLDTITYLPDPAKTENDPSLQMVSIIDQHSRFTQEEVRKLSIIYRRKFDSYDEANNEDAKEFVLNSIDDDIKREVKQRVKITECAFAELWMRIIHVTRFISRTYFNTLIAHVKERKISDYHAENIITMSKDYYEDWKTLHDAGAYDHQVTADMLKEMMKAGGTGNEGYVSKLRELRDNLDEALIET